jgi:hypothetical protein
MRAGSLTAVWCRRPHVDEAQGFGPVFMINPKLPRMIKLKWTNKSSKFPMKIVDWNRRENPVGYPAGRRHAPHEPD